MNLEFRIIGTIAFVAIQINASHVISLQPKSLTRINITDTFETLTCYIKGSSFINIQWGWKSQNDKTPSYYFEIETNENAIPPGIVIESQGFLYWKADLTAQDKKKSGGILSAYATHGQETTTCDDATIEIHWPPTTTDITPLTQPEVMRDKTFTLTCSSPDKGSPVGDIVWTLNNTIQERFTNDVLTIASAQSTHSGVWNCYYKNYLGSSNQSPSVNITVVWPASDVVFLITNSGPYAEYNDVDTTCSYSNPGFPVASVYFTFENEEYNNVAIVKTGEFMYRITNITRNENGLWICCYRNVGGTSCSQPKNITVQWKPGKPQISPLSLIKLLTGETLSLSCLLDTDKGNPVAIQAKWKLNGIDTLYTNNSLKIENATKVHQGDWNCYYYNTVGIGILSDITTVTVSIGRLPSKANLTSDSGKGEVYLYSSLKLTCSTQDKGNPSGMANWRKDFAFYRNYDEVLTIENLTINGNWECYYENRLGRGPSGRANITVVWNVSTGGEIKLKAANQDVREGDDVTLEYELTDKGSPEARVTWTHNDTAKSGESNYTLKLEDVTFSDSGVYSCYANNSFSKSDDVVFTLKVEPRQEMQIWVYIVIGVCCGIIIIVIIVIVICVVKKKKGEDQKSDSIGYANRSLQPDNMTGTGPANKPNVEAAAPVYAAVSRGKVLAPIAAGADGSVYSHVDLSKKTARQSLKGLPMSKKAIDRIIFHKKDGYVNMTFQVRKKFIGDIEIGVCRIGDQSCTSKVSKQHDGASKDVVMVLPIEDSSPDSYSIRIKFTERGQLTQTVDLTYPYNKNAVNVTVLNEVHSTNVSPSYADVEVEGVPPRPSRQGYPAEGVTYAVMDWDRSQAPGRPPRLSSRSPAQEHVVYADVRPGGNVY